MRTRFRSPLVLAVSPCLGFVQKDLAQIANAVVVGRTSILILQITLLSGLLWGAEKAKIANLSYGDYIDTTQPSEMAEGVNLASKAGIEKSFRALRDSGYTTIYWRMAFEGHPM